MGEQPAKLKRVAAVVTEYRRHSHADIILGKILEGYLHDGRAFPRLRLVSLYVDQFPEGDLSRALAQRHGFTIFDTIGGAVTAGGAAGGVDGVLIIAEHGRYPTNNQGQILYPRRRFFEAVTQVFSHQRRVVPVFIDKHFAATWPDARWMYDRAREMNIPLLAGSTLPLTWRRPELRLSLGCSLAEAVQVGYGPFEGYGFHALEALQCMVERRGGGETGVRSVQCLQGPSMWQAMDKNAFSRTLLEAAMARIPAHASGDFRTLTAQARDAGVFLIEYRDGLRAAVAILNGWAYEGDGGAFTFACRLSGQDRPVATHFYLQQPDPFAHFAYLLRAIEAMIQSNKPPYPVERTLLTTGILEAVMRSVHQGNRRIDTPHLKIAYRPTDWGHATDPIPARIRR